MKMRESKRFKEVNVYEYGDFLIEITVSNKDYEAWIRHEDYGIAQLMFGQERKDVTYAVFKAMVYENLDEYIELYREEYMND